MVEAAIWLLVQGDKAGAEDLLTQVLRQDPTHERARQAMRSVGAPTSPGAQAPPPPIPGKTVPIVPAMKPPDTASTPLEPQPALRRPEHETARVSRAELEAGAEAPERNTRQYGFDPEGLAKVRAAMQAQREGAPVRAADVEALLGGALRRNPQPSGLNPFDARPEDSTLPGKRRDLGAGEPSTSEHEAAGAEAFDSTALDLSLERALNELPPPTSADHPHIEHTSRQQEGATDKHLSLVRPAPGTSGTHPELAPVLRQAPPSLAEAPVRASGATAIVAREWTLRVMNGASEGLVLTVGRRPVLLGRGLGAMAMDDDPFVSPAHASFFLRGADLFVADGASVSGTWHTISGVHRLATGESFAAGQQRLRFLGPVTALPRVEPLEYGAPVPAASWRLEQTLVGLRPGRAWVLRGIVSVGRGPSSLRFPDDPALAPLHVELRPAGHELELVDRSQGLGTWVCLPSAAERRVPPGALVRIGSTVLQVTAP
jgi:hypothetical protein